jgi:hypothetical protein
MKHLGTVDYARHRKALGLPGQTHAAVKKAIDRGTLTKKSVQRSGSGRAQINPELADWEWAAMTDPAQQRDPATARGRYSPAVDGAVAGALNPELRINPGTLDEAKVGEVAAQASIRLAQSTLITFRAKNAQLDYELRARQLCRASEVEESGFKIGRQVRENLLNLPAKISAQLAAENDQHKVSRLLTKELIDALEALLPLIEAIAETPPPQLEGEE